jgi:hypothetical protein
VVTKKHPHMPLVVRSIVAMRVLPEHVGPRRTNPD